MRPSSQTISWKRPPRPSPQRGQLKPSHLPQAERKRLADRHMRQLYGPCFKHMDVRRSVSHQSS